MDVWQREPNKGMALTSLARPGLDELRMAIVGYDDTAQLFPINVYHILIVLIRVVIYSNGYSCISFRNLTCACKISLVINCDSPLHH